jgi:hypothetical protein
MRLVKDELKKASTRMTYVEMAKGSAVEAQVAAVPADDVNEIVIGIGTGIQRGAAGTVLESETGTDTARGTVTMVEVKEVIETKGISIIGIGIGIGIGIDIVIGNEIGSEIGEAHRTITEKETGLGAERAAARTTISREELGDQSITIQTPKNVPSVGIEAVKEIGGERRQEKRRAWPTASCVKHLKSVVP